MMRNHRGFTLIELLVVLVIMTIVTGGIYKLLNQTQRLSRAQTERIDLQSNVRTAAIVVPAELRGINTVVGGTNPQVDIEAMTNTSIKYRSMWGLGFVCGGTTSTSLRLSNWTGTRPPTFGRDSVYVFNDNGNEGLGSDDTWDQTRIDNSTTANNCTGGGAAMTLTIPDLGRVPANGTPVRVFEVMELTLYVSDGKSWLGMRSASADEPMQPLLGPLRDDDGANPGLKFTYLDAGGNQTATPANVKSIVVTIRGVTNQVVSAGGGNANNTLLYDQLVTQVSLRNALR